MLKELIDNLDMIDKHVANLDKSVKEATRETMIAGLLAKEGMIVSRRKRLTAGSPMASGYFG